MTDSPAPAGTVLVVDDEENIRALLSATLRLTGFIVETADGGADGLRAATTLEPDLLVLDVMLPDMDGFEVARRLRESGHRTPVLFLTARHLVRDRVAGMRVGDDYVTKPFDLEEVVLRVQAILRRASATTAPPCRMLRYHDLELDEDAHEVRRAGSPIELSPTEFRLLKYLMTNAGRVVSKGQILDRVWNYDFGGNGRVVESYVYYLRRKIDVNGPPLIQTVRGFGYSLRLPATAR